MRSLTDHKPAALQRTTSKLLQSYRIPKYHLKDPAQPRTRPQSESKAHSILSEPHPMSSISPRLGRRVGKYSVLPPSSTLFATSGPLNELNLLMGRPMRWEASCFQHTQRLPFPRNHSMLSVPSWDAPCVGKHLASTSHNALKPLVGYPMRWEASRFHFLQRLQPPCGMLTALGSIVASNCHNAKHPAWGSIFFL